MLRRLPVLFAALAALLVLAACSKGDPEVAVADQLPADQAAALQEAEGAEAEGEGAEGEAAEGEGGGGEVAGTFVAVDIDYSDAPAELPAGSATLELVNEGNAIHNVVFEELGDQVVAEANGGESATGTVELEPGEYTYYCSIPGHRAAGMEGTLTVA